jgi:putative membrane-bound dehydrogenase-like protein
VSPNQPVRLFQPASLVCVLFLAALVQAQPPFSNNLTNTPDTQDIPDTADKDYSAELPRIPAKTAAEAQAELEVLEGFEVRLVAAEPLVSDPVAFAFDPRGRLFVVEMRDYSEQATERLGRIALLEDRDGDGVMDVRSTFVEGLSWPTAIWPWRDGVLVAEPPHITWYRDTDGDDRSDVSETWFTGFSRGNVQGLVNSLRWGVDGMIHGATSSSGADVELLAAAASADDGTAPQVNLGRRDFAIDPLSKTLHPETGGGQHGMSFNRWGDKFVTSNSDHLQQVIDLDDWLASHPSAVPMPSSRRSIAVDGPQAEVFRASPIEPWRIVRTRLRVSGVTPGIVEGGGRAAGYFTGATGTWIVDREFGFGDPAFDTALVCDVGSNLVHRKRLTDEGLFWSGSRLDAATELLRSRDTWFRPVQLGDGPDGAIYIADMAREVIEHPQSLPPMIKRHLDLTSGRELGRIWRLSSPHTPRRPTLNMTELSSEALVELLGDAIPWRRLMASQLLIERADSGLTEMLAAAVTQGTRPEGRLLALHVAARLGQCDASLLSAALKDSEPRVVEQAIRLTRQLGLAESLLENLQVTTGLADASLADTGRGNTGSHDTGNHDTTKNNARVQLALAMLASDLPPAKRPQLLEPMLAHVSEPLVRGALAAAAGNDGWRLLSQVDRTKLPSSTLKAWLNLWLPTWGTAAGGDAELASWLRSQLVPGNPQLAEWLDSLCQLSSRRAANQLTAILSESDRAALIAWIEEQLVALDEQDTNPVHANPADDATPGSSPRRWAWLGLLPAESQARWSEELFQPSVAEGTQILAMRALAWAEHPQLATTLLDNFSAMTPSVQREALRQLLTRATALEALATALDLGQIRRSQIPPETKQQLLAVGDATLAARFAKLLDTVSADRAAVIATYSAAWESHSSTVDSEEAGGLVFARACAGSSPAAHTAGSSCVGLWPFGNQWVAAVRGLTATALVVSASGLKTLQYKVHLALHNTRSI